MKVVIFPVLALLLLFVACSRENADDLYKQAQALEQQEKPGQALPLYERIYNDFGDAPVAPEAMFRAAQLYLREQNDPVKAATTYELIAERYPQHRLGHQALFVAGFTYADHLRNFTKAKEVYEKYLATYPDSSMAPTAQFELDHLGMSAEEVLSQQQEKAE
jgi:TolA-binding protein